MSEIEKVIFLIKDSLEIIEGNVRIINRELEKLKSQTGIPVIELGVSGRAYNALVYNGITHINNSEKFELPMLMKLPAIGKTTAREIREKFLVAYLAKLNND